MTKTAPPRIPGATESAFRALIRTCGLLGRVMHPYFARLGISGSQWGILRTLHRAEEEGSGGLRLTDLGDRLLIRPASVTGAIDRLQRLGLVARDISTADLRAKQVSLTANGRHLVQRVLSGHAAQIANVMAGLSPEELEQLERLLSRLGAHFESLLAT